MLPGGVLGTSMLLASASAAAAIDKPADPLSVPEQSVDAQLRAIRAGVTALVASGATEDAQAAGSALPPGEGEPQRVATWWGNGGWGRWHYGWHNGGFGWPNWHNWNNWHNGGNNGWNNGGSNGWNNWGNGWHNYWHNV
jgi:hypothetical protein